MPFAVGYKRKRPVSSKGSSRRKAYVRRKYTRPTRTVRGRGAYYVTGGASASGSLGPLKGSAHMNAGYSQGGDKVLSYIAPRVTGTGAYNVNAIKSNVLVKPGIATVYNTIYTEGGTVVRHREYLGPVVTDAVAGKFKATAYPLNPAQSYSFPWLSSIAANYEEYKPNGVFFEYRSTCSDAIASSTNLALGQIMMCTQYDPTDNNFGGEVEMLNYFWSQNGKVSDDIHHFIECDPAQSPLSHFYTREGGLSSQTDLRFSDFGRFTIATSGLQGQSVTVGQLWVSYEFIFYKPKMGALAPEAGGWFRWQNDTSVTYNMPFGQLDQGEFDAASNLKIVLSNGNAHQGRIQFPQSYQPATYLVWVNYIYTTAASSLGPVFSKNDGQVKFIKLNSLYFQEHNPDPASIVSDFGAEVIVSIAGDGLEHWVNMDLQTDHPFVNLQVAVYVSQIPYMNPVVYPSQ